ncbi:ABC transporter family substrate-binding protein [Nocardiopsis sp. RSe5-2]|uniref:ABC transporter family substrate-binding protein n=1 Tax=Nocardiopsis endophytica TaxID=3018445 RepID=A0ABT4UE66_9ACTN|nr:ABC transporter family substrate-binding protein [Nocardiopsis endophytica]MDA2815167.1 ABC transporter family substrate-binding protein [Nocardiopsis endophytica]
MATVRNSSRLTGPAAALAALALAATACTGGGGGDGGTGAGGVWEECEAEPNTCNSGEAADGGEITWVVSDFPGAWTAVSPEGGSVYTLQMLSGILPRTGQWSPDGETYEFNMDLLAEEPELVSEDPFTFSFTFNDKAVWDDGTPIGADDFIATVKMSTSDEEGWCEGCRSRQPGIYDDVEEMEASDDGRTVTITLKEGRSNPEWQGFLDAHQIAGGLLPAHLAEDQGYDLEEPEDVGAYFEWLNETVPEYSGGPYKIVEGDLETQVIMEPNENWYGEVQPTLDTVVIQFNDAEDTWVPALTNGEIDGGSPAKINNDVIEQMRGMPSVSVDVGPGASWEHIDLNTENEWLQDVELRRAVFTAIDAQEIAERGYGTAFPDVQRKTNHTFSADSPYHEDLYADSPQGTGDVEEATRMLEEAGYEISDGTLMRDGEQVGPFRLRATADQVRQDSLQIIQSQLEEIGVATEIETIDDLGGVLGDQDYDIVQFGWSGSPWFVINPGQQWHSGSGSNFGGLDSEDVDEALEGMGSATTLEEAAAAANEAGRQVVEEAYVLPLVDEPRYSFVTDGFVNIRDNRQHSLRATYNIGQWGVAGN